MFENLQCLRQLPAGTEARLELPEQGIVYYFSFTTRITTPAFPHASTQVLSRVFAIPPERMAGYNPKHWASSMRYDVVRAQQHLPTHLETV